MPTYAVIAYAVILAMGLAGYAGAPWWVALAGAACLALGSWRVQLWRLARQPRVAWSSKTTTYFVTGIVLDIGLAGLSFGAGRIARAALG